MYTYAHIHPLFVGHPECIWDDYYERIQLIHTYTDIHIHFVGCIHIYTYTLSSWATQNTFATNVTNGTNLCTTCASFLTHRSMKDTVPSL